MNLSLLVILCISSVIIVGFIILYNKLVRNRNRMQEAWSVIDVCLKKRYDLVPALVEIVKGYATHEKGTLDEVTRCRTATIQAQNQEGRMQSEAGLGDALKQLFVVVESYPELKANTNFLTLQQQLTDIEDELAMSRRYYNGTVRENNILIESFPSNLVAGICHFPKGEFFIVDPAGKEAPEVSF